MYKTRDGRWIHLVFNTNPHRWPELAALLGQSHIANDNRFATPQARIAHSTELIPILDAAFAERDHAQWVELLEQHRFTFGDVRKIDELLTDEQMVQGRVLRAIDDLAAGASYIVDSQLWVEGCKKSPPAMPP